MVESMPTGVESLAHPFTWLGGAVGITLVVTGVSVTLIRHYLADVLAGACLGLAWFCTCLLVDASRRSRRVPASTG